MAEAQGLRATKWLWRAEFPGGVVGAACAWAVPRLPAGPNPLGAAARGAPEI